MKKISSILVLFLLLISPLSSYAAILTATPNPGAGSVPSYITTDALNYIVNGGSSGGGSVSSGAVKTITSGSHSNIPCYYPSPNAMPPAGSVVCPGYKPESSTSTVKSSFSVDNFSRYESVDASGVPTFVYVFDIAIKSPVNSIMLFSKDSAVSVSKVRVSQNPYDAGRPLAVVPESVGKIKIEALSDNISDAGSFYSLASNSSGTITVSAEFKQSDMVKNLFDLSINFTPSPVPVIDPINPPVSASSSSIILNSQPEPVVTWGSPVTLSWTSTGNTKQFFVSVFREGNSVRLPNLGGFISGDVKTFTLNTASTTAGKFKIRVGDSSNAAVYAETSYFEVASRAIILKVPTFVTAGNEAVFSWSSNFTSNSFDVSVMQGNKVLISSNVSGDTRSYTWLVPKDGRGSYAVTVKDHDTVFKGAANLTVSQLLMSQVTVTPSVVRGDTLPISWQANSSTGAKVKVILYKGDKAVKTISSGILSEKNPINFIVPANTAPGTDYSVRVGLVSASSIFATSSQFEIKKPEIAITPVPTNVLVGQPVTFTWSNTGTLKGFNVKVVSITTGKTVVSKSVGADVKTYTWTTTSKTPVGSYKLVISDRNDKMNVVESQPFNIVKTMPVSESAPSQTKSFLGNVWEAVSGWWK